MSRYWTHRQLVFARNRYLQEERDRLAARVTELEAALRYTLKHPKWVSIGSIDNHVQLPRIPRADYERLAALALFDRKEQTP